MFVWCDGNVTSVLSLKVILSVAYRIDLSREQKKEMHAPFVESLKPSPPIPTGVAATNQECSGKGEFAGRCIMFASRCFASWSDFVAKGVLVSIWVIDSVDRIDDICKCADFDSMHCLKKTICAWGSEISSVARF